MGYISEDYCSEELSGILMERGYIGAIKIYLGEDDINVKQITIQSAMKWLREVHSCHIYVQALLTTDGLQGYCPFYTKVGGVSMWQNPLGDDYATAPTYEEACEAAIRYCLENLI